MTQVEQYSSRILAKDRAWFAHHSSEVVRFRPVGPGELEHLKSNGISAPEFRPSWCNSCAPLERVAVIDLTRLLQSKQPSHRSQETLRIRVLTIKARSNQIRTKLHEELIEAVCAELLILLDQTHNHSRSSHRAA